MNCPKCGLPLTNESQDKELREPPIKKHFNMTITITCPKCQTQITIPLTTTN